MKFFWSPRTRAIRIAWLLEETGLDYELVQVDVHTPPPQRDPDLLAASPMGKVPAIIDGPVKLWDSGAITLYLADQYPETGLTVPIGDPQRGMFLFWCMYTNSVIEPAMGEKMRNGTPNAISSGYGSFDAMIKVLVEGLKPGPWIMGERFTAADTLVGSSVFYMDFLGMLPDETVLKDYAARCLDRPAFKRAQAMEAR